MKTESIRWGRAAVAGLAATLVGFLVGGVLYGSVNSTYESFGELPYAKPMGSVGSYLGQMLAGGTVLNVLFALVYAIVQEALPGQRAWQKGLAFGVMLVVVNMLPIAFNTWMQIAQPIVLILIEALNRTLGLLVQAVVMALVYGRLAVSEQIPVADVG